MKKRILLLGDRSLPRYHPLDEVVPPLSALLGVDYDLTITEDYPELTAASLGDCDLIINYIDNWAARGGDRAAGVLLSHMSLGGRLLTLHSGLIMKTHPELEAMQGGRFEGHPESCELAYLPADSAHPILREIEPFVLFEEPYRFTVANLPRPEMLLTYLHEDKEWPAGWVLPYGLGQVVYLSMGHRGASLTHPMVQRLVLNSVKWLLDESTGC